MAKNVLVLAVHPDDETLGCGGTLLKHKQQGDNIHWLIATAISTEQGFSAPKISQRKGEIEKVASLYGFKEVHQLGLPTTKVDTLPKGDLIQKIAAIINRVQPEILYLPFHQDIHSDHRVIFEAAFSCTKTFRYPFIRRIYLMETISETNYALPFPDTSFIPNSYVDISDVYAQKLEIAAVYDSEMGTHPFPRRQETLKALAMFRGATANCQYAESFMLIKEIR